ncbi:MAG: hypothetical protein RBU45_23980, partial [Myxococcota bacterium]|nr:hypothetical protein [Myxococcota bacterium]
MDHEYQVASGRGWAGLVGRVLLLGGLALPASSCSDQPSAEVARSPGMDGDTANCPYPLLTLKTADGELHTVSVNDLPVHELSGAAKNEADVIVVTRRGVRFADLFARLGLALDDAWRVNAIARDGYDPLRGRLGRDRERLPWVGFLRAHGYVYLDAPGDKDALYPKRDGQSLSADYVLASD